VIEVICDRLNTEVWLLSKNTLYSVTGIRDACNRLPAPRANRGDYPPLGKNGVSSMRDKIRFNDMIHTYNTSRDPKDNSPQENIDAACALLSAIVDTLIPEKRQIILNSLPPNHNLTFEELKKETGLSTGSLHHHLTELWRAGFIDKTESRPTEYSRSKSLEYLLALVEEATKNSRTSFDMLSQKHQYKIEV
jgi:DNA-binding HxlR family transcriptional regulator